MNKIKASNIFYFRVINKIGGIETFFYQIAKKYKDYDIAIVYTYADEKQLERLKNYVKCIKYVGQKVECKKAFFNFNLEIIDNVEADEYIQILHGDYKGMKISPNTNKKINRYIGVSNVVTDSFFDISGIEAKTIYNPIEVQKPQKVLKLISATRLTSEKGKDRIIKFANELEKNNIKYLWTIFTDDIYEIENDNIIYMKPNLNIIDYIADSDYLVQLSDNEGYCYSVVESLSAGTPVIVTDMPVMKEIGVNKENGFILDFNLCNLDVKEIYNKDFNFKYIPKKDNWDSEIIKDKSNYKEELRMKIKVEALDTYARRSISDSELGRIPVEGERFEVDKVRLDVLLGANEYKEAFVKVIEEVKEEQEETVEKKTKELKPKKKTTTKKK